MVNILDKYGIKEVADLTFYHISDEGTPDYPVLYIDTAKVSTLEFTSETADARGGKGNPKLITWDYGKEITVSIEDALFSAKSMAIMFGNGSVKEFTNGLIMKTETFKAKASGDDASACGWSDKFEAPNGKLYAKHNAKFFNADSSDADAFVKGSTYFCSYDLLAEGAVIEVSANSFPGTYYVTGDTFARSEVNGEDEFFQFIIPKAKVTSENTITLEAEGDPSVFNMNLTVLRPDSGDMIQLVKYDLAEEGSDAVEKELELPHNHGLNGANTEAEEDIPAIARATDGIAKFDLAKKNIKVISDKTAVLDEELSDLFNANGEYDEIVADAEAAGKKVVIGEFDFAANTKIKQVNDALSYYGFSPAEKEKTYADADTYAFVGVQGSTVTITLNDNKTYTITIA